MAFMLVLRDVLFVPSLHRNLISVSRLDKDGYGCHFENGKCELWLIIIVLVMLSFIMSFIYYLCMIKYILCMMRM